MRHSGTRRRKSCAGTVSATGIANVMTMARQSCVGSAGTGDTELAAGCGVGRRGAALTAVQALRAGGLALAIACAGRAMADETAPPRDAEAGATTRRRRRWAKIARAPLIPRTGTPTSVPSSSIPTAESQTDCCDRARRRLQQWRSRVLCPAARGNRHGKEGWAPPHLSAAGGLATENGTRVALAGDASRWLDGRLRAIAGVGSAGVGPGVDSPRRNSINLSAAARRSRSCSRTARRPRVLLPVRRPNDLREPP